MYSSNSASAGNNNNNNNVPVPGSLQPGGATGSQSGRPSGPQSAYTAPSGVPTVPHINTNAQQYTLPTRSNTMHMPQSSHSYSRSSPAGLQDQKYIPFSAGGNPPSGGGDGSNPQSPPLQQTGQQLAQKYPQTPQQKFFNPQTPSAGSSASPLALEQIRPRANSSMNDEAMAMYGDLHSTNSNYMAPWAVFAFDWCKYPILGGSSAGKMAIGSYLEDPHNFV
jgi:WD repeat-containing protein 68